MNRKFKRIAFILKMTFCSSISGFFSGIVFPCFDILLNKSTNVSKKLLTPIVF